MHTLDRWKSEFLAEHSPTTFNIALRMLRAAFNVAIKWEFLETNPCDGVRRESVQEKRLFFTGEELTKIFNLIDADIDRVRHSKQKRFLVRFRLLVEFLLYTGLRRNEALSLRQADVDLARSIIYVAKTKSKKFRMVPLTPQAKAILIRTGDELFGALCYQDVTRKFADYLKKLGLTGFKLHSLRHTFATMLIRQGVDIYQVSYLLGHSDIKTTAIYGKVTVEALEASIARLDYAGMERNQNATTSLTAPSAREEIVETENGEAKTD